MMSDENEKKAAFAIASEILFALLPIIVILFIIIFTSNDLKSLFFRSELSFISVFFYGQTLVKLISGLLRSKRSFKWQIIVLYISVIIIVGLIPSVILLSVIFLEINTMLYIYIIQAVWFFLALFTFFVIGRIGQMYIDERSQ